MLLPNQLTKMRWHSRNKDYYTNRGYVYTKMGDEFDVRVEDLPPQSHAWVLVQCDYCGVVSKTKYQAYTNNTQNSCHDADCKSFFHVLHLRLPYNRYIFFKMLIHPFASFYNECFHLFYITIIERIISIIPFITISNHCAA